LVRVKGQVLNPNKTTGKIALYLFYFVQKCFVKLYAKFLRLLVHSSLLPVGKGSYLTHRECLILEKQNDSDSVIKNPVLLSSYY
jgi:hypothetical protein